MNNWVKSLLLLSIVAFQGCGIGGYHIAIYKNVFPYSGVFNNSTGINLAYRIRFPNHKVGDTEKKPFVLYIDGSGPFPLDMTKDNILSHFQSKGFVAAMKQKRGIKPSEGNFKKLTFEERIQDNLDFIHFLLKKYPEIDPDQIYIMGHSEGATVTGTVAYRYRKAAGLVWVSAGINEDFFDYIVSVHPKRDKKLIEEIRDGNNLRGKWQYYSKKWWYQRFNHQSLPELMELSCPIIFLIGDKDDEFLSLQKRFNEMIKKGKKNISLIIMPFVGHGTIAPINQKALMSSIDKWIENN